MKVVLNRRPTVDLGDFNFITERSGFNDPRDGQRFDRLGHPIYHNWAERAKAISEAEQAETPKVPFEVVGVEDNRSDKERLKAIMSQFGNSISDMFKWLMDQIAKIPGLMRRIGGHLKSLWGKIKGWMTKFYIVDRAKSLSMLTISCVGFIATTISLCIHGVVGASPDSSNIFYYAKRFKHPEQYINKKTNGAKKTTSNTNKTDDASKTTTNADETAVFIEMFGEILREDANGGVFTTVARKFIKRGKKIADDVYIACRDSANRRLKNLVSTLRTLVYGSSEALEDGSIPLSCNTIPSRFRRRLYNETAFDNSLASFYESIIQEAQAHKLRSIRKKAIKKVALKNAKRSLKG